ncbi:MAG: CotH kinase family protein, partial [Prevotellaceae bacterium]|nr:CotH kinase family protein [Prevotellaceae bacterium]
MYKLLTTLAFLSVLTFSPITKMHAASVNDLIINEIMPANIDTRIDPSWNYGGFIELYNPTDANISIFGIWLSDDAGNLKKWQFRTSATVQKKGYYLIWFDHNDVYCTSQCPFKLDTDGGTIFVSDRLGNLITSQEYPTAVKRCSYARTTDGGSTWGWCTEPSINSISKTLGATNNNSQFASIQLEAPIVDKIGQVFTGTLQVSVNIPEGATLRYTTNGSVPSMKNGTTSKTGIFSVAKSTSYRFRLFKDGYLPSDVVTRSYIYNDKNFCVPIISVVTDDKNINGQEYGIFVQGSGNGRPGRGQNGNCNWNMDWDRPVSMEYFEDGKEVCFAQEVNMSMCGGWSRAWTPHSFKLKANKVYGLKYMPYSFFSEKPYVKTKTLQIRNGGNGALENRFKLADALLQGIVARSGIDIDYQCYKPSFVYINGQFYGVLNIREANNKHFAYSNRGLDDDEIDQFEEDPDSNYVQMEGTKDAFKELYNLTKTATNTESYEKIKNLLDIDEFINYMAIELYLGGDDWPHNNVKGYRPRIENGKFRFVLFDLDFAFNRGSNAFTAFANEQRYTFNAQMGKYAGKQLQNAEIEFVTIFLNLLNNEEFRKKFIDTFCMVAGSIF